MGHPASTEDPIDPIPSAKQTETLGGVPYHTSNNKKKLINNGNLFQETTTETAERNKRENDRPIQKNNEENRSIRPPQQTSTGQLLRGDVISRRYHDVYHCRNIRI